MTNTNFAKWMTGALAVSLLGLAGCSNAKMTAVAPQNAPAATTSATAPPTGVTPPPTYTPPPTTYISPPADVTAPPSNAVLPVPQNPPPAEVVTTNTDSDDFRRAPVHCGCLVTPAPAPVYAPPPPAPVDVTVVEQKPKPVKKVREREDDEDEESCSEGVRVGAATLNANFDLAKDPRFFDSAPGEFCGLKAVRVTVLGRLTPFNQREYIDINRIFFGYEKRPAKGPFANNVKVHTHIRHSETTDWIPVPGNGGSCLKRVRVEAEGHYNNPIDPDDGTRVVVCGIY